MYNTNPNAKPTRHINFHSLSSREVKSIWRVTQAFRNNEPVDIHAFDHVCQVLDEKYPDLHYDQLVALANLHGYTEEK